MRALPVLALAFLTLAGCDKLKGKSTGTVAGGGVAGKSPDNLKLDKVKEEGGPIGTDGSKDGAITFTIEGKVIGIVLTVVDDKGEPSQSQQWDTYIQDQPLPKAVKFEYAEGGPTWQLGVWEGGKMKNAADGTLVPLGDGPHSLTLYASDSGYFTPDHKFAVFAERPDHSVVKSNVFTF